MKNLAIKAVLIASVCSGLHVLTAHADTHNVSIDALKFSPSSLIVKKGDTVIFHNQDLIPHTVTETSSGKFDSEILNSDETWTLNVSEVGALKYHCKIHPSMEGEIRASELIH